MHAIEHQLLAVNGIQLSLYSCGPQDGPPVWLLHGFPELAYSWRKVMVPLAAASRPSCVTLVWKNHGAAPPKVQLTPQASTASQNSMPAASETSWVMTDPCVWLEKINAAE